MQNRTVVTGQEVQEASKHELEGLTKTLSEIKIWSEENGGRVSCERKRWKLDPSDADDAPLIQLFEEAGLSAERPEHWRLLLDLFANDRYAKKGRKPAVRPSDDHLVREAYVVAKRHEAEGRTISLPRVCEELCKAKDYRIPAQYRDPQGALHPKTLQNRLEAHLTNWEDEKDLPHTLRNYEYVPQDDLDQLAAMFSYLRSLPKRTVG